jgi:hypothetical protein
LKRVSFDLRNLKPGVDASLEEPKVGFFFSCHIDSWERRASLDEERFSSRDKLGERGEINGWFKLGYIYAFLLFLRKKEDQPPTPSPPLVTRAKLKLRLFQWSRLLAITDYASFTIISLVFSSSSLPARIDS